MRLIVVMACSLWFIQGAQADEDEWLDPYDMLNYDASTKTMRKSDTERTIYDSVPTKRRGTEDQNQLDMTACNNRVEGLLKELEEQKRKIAAVPQQPSCVPVFMRFLRKLVKEMDRLGLPSDPSSVLHYDAKVKLSHQSRSQINKLLNDVDSWRTGALDDALSEILVDLKPHDYEAWKWRFEDTFNVEIDTVIKVFLLVLIIVAIICIEVFWSWISWYVQFARLFAICFFISLVWNWFFLYKTAFAEHQSNMVKMESINEKCTGLKKIDWQDNLKEWFRVTWTFQDDPCKKYYEHIMVNPIWLVPPNKAISVTITTLFTEPLKHIGQGISEFLRALLKDLPAHLQIIVLLTIVISILLFLYGSVQAAFQYGIMAPLRGGHRGPPPPAVEHPQPQPYLHQLGDRDDQAGGDAPRPAPAPLRSPRRRANQNGRERNIRQRKPNRVRQEPQRVFVETLGRSAERRFTDDEIDARGREDADEAVDLSDDLLDVEESEEDQQEGEQEETAGAAPRGVVFTALSEDALALAGEASTLALTSAALASQDGLLAASLGSNRQARTPREGRPSPTTQGNDNQVQEASSEENPSLNTVDHVETIGLPVQETEPTSIVS